MFDLLSKLHSGFSKSVHNHERFSIGKWGMNLQGYLLMMKLSILDKFLKTLKWSVAADEPLDGGVRTFARDLSMILRMLKNKKQVF